ncbi:MAG: hypothetical protein U0821_00810 [Chloroflexota bacterium]
MPDDAYEGSDRPVNRRVSKEFETIEDFVRYYGMRGVPEPVAVVVWTHLKGSWLYRRCYIAGHEPLSSFGINVFLGEFLDETVQEITTELGIYDRLPDRFPADAHVSIPGPVNTVERLVFAIKDLWDVAHGPDALDPPSSSHP